MRYYGTITRWNNKRGFGAATIEDTGQEIFLALAAFTTLTRLPAEGQHISFNNMLENNSYIDLQFDHCIEYAPLIQ